MDTDKEIRELLQENEKIRKELGEPWYNAPEYSSIESFAQYCKDDERTEYTHEDMIALTTGLKLQPSDVREQLRQYGLTLAKRPIHKHTRGYTTSSHDRWFGPGSSPTHGGSGFRDD
jgi:transposase